MKFKLNLFIIGMQKAGTTSIFNFLKKSRMISHTKIKETNFFADEVFIKKNYKLNNTHSNYIRDLIDLNKNIVRKEKSLYVLEGSVNHFYSENAPKKIFEYNPDAKLILIVRDPIQRILSHYLMDLNLGFNAQELNKSIIQELNSKPSFGSDLGYLKMSLIKKNYDNWRKYFDKNKILLLNFDDLSNQNLIKEKLNKFLSLNLNNLELNYDNQGRVPRFINLNKIIMKIRNFLPFDLNSKFFKDLYYKLFFSKKEKYLSLDINIEKELNNYFKDDYSFLKSFFKKNA